MTRREGLSAFGEIVREECAKRGWSQRELSRRTGIHEAWLSRCMHGYREPSRGQVVAVSRAFGLTARDEDVLFAFTGYCSDRMRYEILRDGGPMQ